MNIDLVHRAVAFVLFSLVQALVLNQVSLFGYATPLLYILFVITFRRGYSRSGMLLWCFALGLVNDTFTNTPGVATASLTIMGFIQPYVLMPFIPRESADDLQPSAATLGWGAYATYSLIMTATFCFLYFLFEAFTFANILVWLAEMVGSTLITYAFILVLENFRRKQAPTANN